MKNMIALLVFLLATSAILISCSSEPPVLDLENAAAVVNGEVIQKAEINKQLDRLISKFREASPKLQFSDDKKSQMTKNFLDRAIHDKILLQEADKQNITVEDAEIDTRIDQLKKIFGGGSEGEDRFMAGIKDMAEFRGRIGDQIRMTKLLDSTTVEIKKVTDEEIENYFKENQDRYVQPEQVTVRHILIRFSDSPIKRAEEPSPEEKTAAKEKANDILKRLLSGEDFSQLAKEVSQDPSSAEKGGELPPFGQGRMLKPFEEAAFALKEGEISEVVETKFGYHIIKLEKKSDRITPTLDDVRDKIVRSLENQSTKAEQDKYVESLRAKADINILE